MIINKSRILLLLPSLLCLALTQSPSHCWDLANSAGDVTDDCGNIDLVSYGTFALSQAVLIVRALDALFITGNGLRLLYLLQLVKHGLLQYGIEMSSKTHSLHKYM